MEQSRATRKQKLHRSIYRRLIRLVLTALAGGILSLLWYLTDQLIFTLAAVIIFFGILCVQPAYKQYVPGLNSPSTGVRILAAFVYLLGVIALISKVKLTTY